MVQYWHNDATKRAELRRRRRGCSKSAAVVGKRASSNNACNLSNTQCGLYESYAHKCDAIRHLIRIRAVPQGIMNYRHARWPVCTVCAPCVCMYVHQSVACNYARARLPPPVSVPHRSSRTKSGLICSAAEKGISHAHASSNVLFKVRVNAAS